ncbi:MAG: hypothetical protein ACQEP9_07690 [Bacillota bacterium]
MSISIEINEQKVTVDKFLGVLQKEFGREVIAEGNFSLEELKKYRQFLVEATEQLMSEQLTPQEEERLQQIQQKRRSFELDLYQELDVEQKELYQRLFKTDNDQLSFEEELISDNEEDLEYFLDDLLSDLSAEEIEAESKTGDAEVDENKVVDINKYRSK